ncbi:hypothetical protein BD311DRAFT_142729 [Dichomitus squalens]|uniref:Uncharacterized protein n=1 Tax=Dichomitus squalens TaxID=114155 RepID=A0A4Q9M9X8_9APHY|nr:hypothetical protein BD311DRAFT_142729 [Dichomitus squalens]
MVRVLRTNSRDASFNVMGGRMRLWPRSWSVRMLLWACYISSTHPTVLYKFQDSSCFVGPEACIAPHSLMVQKKTTEGVATTFNSVAPSDHSRTSPPVPLISPQIGRIYGQRTHPTFHLPSQLLDASECAI